MKSLLILLCMMSLLVLFPEVSHEITTRYDDRTDLRVVIYQGSLAFIVDTREMELPAPAGTVQFLDVSPSLQPESLDIRSIKPLSIVKRQYQFDRVSSQRLLELYTGKEVKVILAEEFQGLSKPFTAKLLGVDQGKPILQAGSEVFLGHPGMIILPGYEEQLTVHPVLSWDYQVGQKYKGDVSVSYLSSDLDWKADYLFTIPEEGSKAHFQGWLTLYNKGTGSYPKARVEVIAGTLHRTQRPVSPAMMRADMMMAAEAAPSVQESVLHEYYLYPIPGTLDLKPNQSQQVAFLQVENVAFEKKYLVIGRDAHFFRTSHPEEKFLPVEVFISFKNTEENQLGRPLPEGIIRFFQEDANAQRAFIGEDRIYMTPENETLRLKTGQAFDLVARKIQKDYIRISQNVYETEWEITLRNRKKEPVTIGVMESFPSAWNIQAYPHEYRRIDASTIQFDIDIPAGEEKVLRYRVRIDYSR